MSLRRNILANYVGQVYATLIAIVMVPLYVRYMGVEAYGLVGFFAMLQAWFLLLDMGLTPTLARETARYQGGAIDALSLRRLLRALEGIFIGVGLLGAGVIVAASSHVASSWLKVQHLPLEEVTGAIALMAWIVALRWICGLYRGAINGFEKMVWLNGFNIAIATVRFAGIIPFLIYVGATPTSFFTYQLVVAVVESAVLVTKTYRLMPAIGLDAPISWNWRPLRGVLLFSSSIAFTSLAWVLITQSDKLILSTLMPLSDYAYFTLAVLIASGILIVSGPISGALLPRLTRLHAAGDEAGLFALYRNATQLVAAIAIPATLILALFPEQVLWVWTGNSEIAHKASPVLVLYAVGNGIMVLAAFPYYLQFAKGNLKLHLIGNAWFVVIFIPLVIWATKSYGMVGAGYAWIAANLLLFLVWVPIVHRKFMKDLHLSWLLNDILKIVAIPICTGLVLQHTIGWPGKRWQDAAYVVAMGLGLLAAAAIGSSWINGAIRRALRPAGMK